MASYESLRTTKMRRPLRHLGPTMTSGALVVSTVVDLTSSRSLVGRPFLLPEDPIEREAAVGGGAGIFELEGELRAWFEPDAEARLGFGAVFADEEELFGLGGLAQDGEVACRLTCCIGDPFRGVCAIAVGRIKQQCGQGRFGIRICLREASAEPRPINEGDSEPGDLPEMTALGHGWWEATRVWESSFNRPTTSRSPGKSSRPSTVTMTALDPARPGRAPWHSVPAKRH